MARIHVHAPAEHRSRERAFQLHAQISQLSSPTGASLRSAVQPLPEQYFICIWGYYGTQYRVRLFSPFGYRILYKEYDLTRFNHQQNITHLDPAPMDLRLRTLVMALPTVRWVAVKELNLSDCIGETALFTIHIYIYTYPLW